MLSLLLFRGGSPFGISIPGALQFRHIPGQVRGEKEADKRARRIREGTIPAPRETIEEIPAKPTYFEESRQLATKIGIARQEIAILRPRIAQLEAGLAEEKIKIAVKKRADMERALLVAQQRATLLAVQEEVLLEEMTVIDIAYIAAFVLHESL